jgi:glutamate synthase (NADPH/NADH) small chain
MDQFRVFPLHKVDDPDTYYLDPSRKERVHILPGSYPEQDPAERLNNFEMVFQGYSEEQAVVEATRCIHCPATEPCILGCPLHNDIPKAMFAIEQKKFSEAAEIFRETSNYPEFCGRLCPQEVLCEGSCTVGGYNRAVNIGKLEAFCADWQRKEQGGFPIPDKADSSGRKAAVVGSGPSSIAVAEELARDGHEVVVYEEWPKPGGLLHYGIPNFKLDKKLVDAKIAEMESIGIKFICSTRVGRDIQVDDLLDDFDAVFLGIGVPVGHKIKLPGEDLKGVYQATEFLVRGNLPDEDLPDGLKGKPEIGKTVVVIGGGDTSIDCVRTARRLQVQNGVSGGSVVLYYHGTETEMRARELDVKHAKEEGIHFELLAQPVQFLGDDQGAVNRVEMQRMMSKPSHQQEQKTPHHLRIPIEGSNFLVNADTVVLAIGYRGDELIPSQTPELETTRPGIFKVKSEQTGVATMGGVFAAGDDVRGADLVVTATAAGRKAARAMSSYLQGLSK